MSVKVTVKIDSFKKIKAGMKASSVLRPIGQGVVDAVLETIAVGLSPVKNFGRFVGYSSSRGGSYPFSVQRKFPNKRLRPVNLRLSGDMLDSMKAKTEGGKLVVGIFDSQQVEKALTHNKGTEVVPQRKFLPTAKGEDFIVSIKRTIKDLFAKAIDDILK